MIGNVTIFFNHMLLQDCTDYISLSKINKPSIFFIEETLTSAQIKQLGNTVSERIIHQLKDMQVLKCLTGLGPIRQN